METERPKEKMDFEAVYNKYYLIVYFYIYKRIGHRQNAEDMANSVFLSCYQHYDRYDPQRTGLATWIFVMVNNRLKNFYRDRKNLISIQDENFDDGELVAEDCIEEAVSLTGMRNALADALGILTEREKKIVLLKYFYGRDSKEIAAELGMTPVNVRVVLKRTLEKMKKYLVSKYGREQF